MKEVILSGKLWKYEGPAAWYFLSSDREQAEEIRKHQKKGPGWGAVPVRVTIGETTWTTSLFPTKEGPFLLPVKAGVRKAERLTEYSRIEAVCAFL